MPPDDLPWETLARYFAGELPHDEARELERWIGADTARAETVAELRTLWAEADQRQAWNAEAALRRIKQAPTRPAEVIRLPARYREEPRTPWQRAATRAARVAAIAVLAAGTAGVWRIVSQRAAQPAAAPIATSEVATPRGQRASLRLPDGTQVVLGPSSVIKYAVARDRGARQVELSGAAYFEVVHDSARPFTVHTARGTATDLGTRFGVHAYPGDSAMDVVVADGSVSLAPSRDTPVAAAPTEAVILVPGDLGRLTANGHITAAHGVVTDRYLAWTDGRLEFHDTPMRDVVVQLARWYDLDLRLGDSALGSRHLSASFKNESAPDVVRLIAASLDLRVKRTGNSVILQSK